MRNEMREINGKMELERRGNEEMEREEKERKENIKWN
jgi:hypothetical protein